MRNADGKAEGLKTQTVLRILKTPRDKENPLPKRIPWRANKNSSVNRTRPMDKENPMVSQQEHLCESHEAHGQREPHRQREPDDSFHCILSRACADPQLLLTVLRPIFFWIALVQAPWTVRESTPYPGGRTLWKVFKICLSSSLVVALSPTRLPLFSLGSM